MGIRLVKSLTTLDSFSEPVTINYRGEARYKTAVGALTTILTAVIVLAYGTKQFLKLVNKTDPNITNVTSYLDPFDQTEYAMKDVNLDFFFKL